VLDTSVMVAALRSDAGASRRLLAASLQRRVTLLASVPLMIAGGSGAAGTSGSLGPLG
jgi:predicted nucleic acid-binding protein